MHSVASFNNNNKKKYGLGEEGYFFRKTKVSVFVSLSFLRSPKVEDLLFALNLFVVRLRSLKYLSSL